jgi:hypothetical protein
MKNPAAVALGKASWRKRKKNPDHKNSSMQFDLSLDELSSRTIGSLKSREQVGAAALCGKAAARSVRWRGRN